MFISLSFFLSLLLILSVGEKLQKKQDHKSFRMEQALTS